MSAISLYIHIPFCIHRCGYCDFNTYAGKQKLIPAYAQAVRKELEVISKSSPEKLLIHTIYFGGGTPSLLSEMELGIILEAANRLFILSPDVEISLEANPRTVSEEYFNQLQMLGIRRVSLGMQSADPDELLLLERQHTFNDVAQAVEWARGAGINNLNLDLIYGLPKQSLGLWSRSIDAALALQPEHLSLYALTIEHGTPLHRLVKNGQLPSPDDDLAADMYDFARKQLSESGYVQYEISNWARQDQSGGLYSCRHNLQYWRNLPYLGVGAGAHGFINHYRTVDALTPSKYIAMMMNNEIQDGKLFFPATPATVQNTLIDYDTEIGETMMMGLRLVQEGVSRLGFKRRFGIELQDRYMTQIAHFIDLGLLEWAGDADDRLRLTSKGYLIANQVFVDFI